MRAQLQAKKDRIASKDERGFTIIEVLIVLVIAGLIMLIVFLAVPALQRNSRNTTRKNDAARILSAANEYYANKNRTYPPACYGAPSGGLCTAANDTIRDGMVANAGTLSNLTSDQVAILPASSLSGNMTTNAIANSTISAGGVIVVTDGTCNDGQTITQSSGIVIVYGVENSNGTFSVACQ